LRYGKPKGGYIHKIREDGLNGIADTLWDGELTMMSGKLKGG
jgi:hypothetical protein